MDHTRFAAGRIVLFGSGETAAVASRVYQALAPTLPDQPRVAVLETPAGFQPNSAAVAGKVADFLAVRLAAKRPVISIIPARHRHTLASPDDPDLCSPMEQADLIFLGPGSPTFAARQLQASLAWQMLLARHRLGATLILASAAAIAVGTEALPVYEIYKAGSDLYWAPGLDLLGPFGLPLVIVPHWNNAEGGDGLDTRCCFMGVDRFGDLCALLPPDRIIVGIDEHTALLLDPAADRAQIIGRGSVIVRHGAHEQRFAAPAELPLTTLGPWSWPQQWEGIPTTVRSQMRARPEAASAAQPPAEVTALVTARQQARERNDWATSDSLRDRLDELGWQVRDTPAGQVVLPAGSSTNHH